MKKVIKDLAHYLPLFGIFLLAIVAFWQFPFDKAVQTGIVIVTALAYVVWGIVHHALHRDLYLVVVIEYVAVALLGVVAVLVLVV